MSASRVVFATPAIADSSPVISEPLPTRVFEIPVQSRGFGSRVWIVTDASSDLTAAVWGYDATAKTWFKFANVTIGQTATIFSAGEIPLGMPLFVQISTVSSGLVYVGLTEV